MEGGEAKKKGGTSKKGGGEKKGEWKGKVKKNTRK